MGGGRRRGWRNAGGLDDFDLTDLFAVDRAIADDMSTVFSCLARLPDAQYPNECRVHIEEIIHLWRPDLLAATAVDA